MELFKKDEIERNSLLLTIESLQSQVPSLCNLVVHKISVINY